MRALRMHLRLYAAIDRPTPLGHLTRRPFGQQVAIPLHKRYTIGSLSTAADILTILTAPTSIGHAVRRRS